MKKTPRTIKCPEPWGVRTFPLTPLEIEYNNLIDTISTLTAEKNNLKNEVITLRNTINEKEEKNKLLQININKLETEFKSKLLLNEKLIDDKKQEIEVIKTLIIQKEVEKQDIVNKKNELLEEKVLEIDNLSNHILMKEKEITSKNLKIDELSHEICNFQKLLIQKDTIHQQSIQNINSEKILLKMQLEQEKSKLEFINKFVDDFKQEKSELKKELSTYKKSFLKKHDLSVSQSIEIEKLRKEILEMSNMSISKIKNFKEDFEDSNNDIHTTFSHYYNRSRSDSMQKELLPIIKENGQNENASPTKIKELKTIVFPLDKNDTIQSKIIGSQSELIQSEEIKLLGDELIIITENE